MHCKEPSSSLWDDWCGSLIVSPVIDFDAGEVAVVPYSIGDVDALVFCSHSDRPLLRSYLGSLPQLLLSQNYISGARRVFHLSS